MNEAGRNRDSAASDGGDAEGDAAGAGRWTGPEAGEWRDADGLTSSLRAAGLGGDGVAGGDGPAEAGVARHRGNRAGAEAAEVAESAASAEAEAGRSGGGG